jgi:hypothetical protein
MIYAAVGIGNAHFDAREEAGEGKIKAVPPGRHRNGVCTSFSVEAGRGANRGLASA